MTSHDPSAGVPDGAAPAARGRRSPKIRDRHLDLLAVVYIRQSSPQQVLDHKAPERSYVFRGLPRLRGIFTNHFSSDGRRITSASNATISPGSTHQDG